jgi:hypothetical protein
MFTLAIITVIFMILTVATSLYYFALRHNHPLENATQTIMGAFSLLTAISGTATAIMVILKN